jgi:hypothetical protein
VPSRDLPGGKAGSWRRAGLPSGGKDGSLVGIDLEVVPALQQGEYFRLDPQDGEAAPVEMGREKRAKTLDRVKTKGTLKGFKSLARGLEWAALATIGGFRP